MSRELTIEEGLWKMYDSGVRSLNIYWLEDIEEGTLDWWVDVCEDRLDEECGTSWVWDVISEEAIKNDDDPDADYGSIESDIIVGKPFSVEVVKEAVEGWLKDREIEMSVDVIGPGGTVQMERIAERLSLVDNEAELDYD